MRRFSILLVSAAMLVAAPAAASAKPTIEQAEPAGDEEMLAQLQAAIAALRGELYAPGPAIPGWNVGGADPDAELLAAGADRHYFLLRAAGEPPSVIILTDRRIADFVPAEWQLVDSYGSALDSVERPFLQYSVLSPRYVIGTRANGFRRDNVDCSDRISNAHLYELPGETMTEEDESAQLLFRMGLLALEGMTTCTRYEGNRASGWSTRPLLPDGRSLPAIEDPPERLTIVPAAPLAELMRR
ncbi:MAG TPA: hypothetical protein VEW25_04680 [Allosphingosinicella sp.]|nr:hypothetical protein [Allosphingosinicella sp.]